MNFEITLTDRDRTWPITVSPNATVGELAKLIEEQTDTDGISVLQMALASERPLDEGAIVESLSFKHHHVRAHRVCVEVFVEGEPAKHMFPESTRWERVHHWACHRFGIAPDSCANLEMHLNTPDGPLLNERKAIGHQDGCITVWMVKPGSEQNGG